MNRALMTLVACSFALALPNAAPAAPGPAKASPKARMPRAKTKTAPKHKTGVATANKVKATGPGVRKRRGMIDIGSAPKSTPIDPRLAPVFGTMEVKSGGGTRLAKVSKMSAKLLAKKKFMVSAVDPTDGVAAITASGATWVSAPILWRTPGIDLAPAGAIAVVLPMSAVRGRDLKVECEGSFAASMTVQTLLQWIGPGSSGGYVTQSASFSQVGETLKFLVSAPDPDHAQAAFSIAMRTTNEADEFTVTQCSVEKI